MGTDAFKKIFGNKKIVAAIFIVLLLTLLVLPRFIKGKIVGEVFGEKIGYNEFKNIYLAARTQAMYRYGEMFPKVRHFLDLEKQAWEQIVLLKEAKKRKIAVSRDEIILNIAQSTHFYDGRKFNTALYRNFIANSLKSDVDTFERGVKNFLLIEKVYQQVTSGIKLTEREAIDGYKENGDQIKISYALIPLADFKKTVVVTPQEIADYYQKHKDTLVIPPSVDIEYVKLDYPPDAGVQKKVETKYKAQAIFDDFKKSKDLKKSAEKYNFPYRETGFFTREEPAFDTGWNYDFLMTAFEMAQGDISAPLETETGYLIIRSKSKKPAHSPTPAEAQDNIKEILTAEKAQELALKQADNYLAEIKKQFTGDKESFAKAAASLNLTLQESPLLPKKLIASMLGLKADDEKILFALGQEHKLSVPFLTQDQAGFAFLEEFSPADMEKFEQEKSKYAQQVLEQRKEAAFKEFLDDLKIKAGLKTYSFAEFRQ